MSGHHAGDVLLPSLAPLVAGVGAIPTLLLHGNQLSTAGFERLGGLLSPSDSREGSATRLLVYLAG